MRSTGPARVLYWYAVVFLLAFGVLAIAGVGLPFLMLGIALALLSPFRARPRPVWPVLLGVAGFLLGFALMVPASCSQAASARIPPRPQPLTVCHSLAGFEYSGAGSYTPPIWPAVLTGSAGATAGALAGTRVVRTKETVAARA